MGMREGIGKGREKLTLDSSTTGGNHIDSEIVGADCCYACCVDS